MPLKPTIHINGSSPESLEKQYHACVVACSGLVDAIHAAAPNARDYYPQGDNAAAIARDDHALRLRRAKELLDEFVGLHEHVVEQRELRARR